MPDILHRIGLKAVSPERAYDALTSRDALAAWWTDDTRGESSLGAVLHFHFPQGFFDMKVVELVPGKRVRWDVLDGPREWIGTSVQWELKTEGDYTIVLFSHEGWREPVEFMHHCSTKWAVFLLSLKALLETGRGAPSPHDVKIDSWN